jgi:hypothetical protein
VSTRALGAVVLAFLIPGAGHVYLGRRDRGAAFLAIVLAMFAIGIAIEGKVYTFSPGLVLNNLATLGSMGSGLLYFVGRMLGGGGDVWSATYEHGTAFVLTAGAMNLLLVLDAWDIATGRKR